MCESCLMIMPWKWTLRVLQYNILTDNLAHQPKIYCMYWLKVFIGSCFWSIIMLCNTEFYNLSREGIILGHDIYIFCHFHVKYKLKKSITSVWKSLLQHVHIQISKGCIDLKKFSIGWNLLQLAPVDLANKLVFRQNNKN